MILFNLFIECSCLILIFLQPLIDLFPIWFWFLISFCRRLDDFSWFSKHCWGHICQILRLLNWTVSVGKNHSRWCWKLNKLRSCATKKCNLNTLHDANTCGWCGTKCDIPAGTAQGVLLGLFPLRWIPNGWFL